MYSIIRFIPFYKVIGRGTTLILLVFVLIKIYKLYKSKRIKKKFIVFYCIPLLFTSTLVVLINLFRGEGIILSLSELIWLGTPFFFLWILGSEKFDSEKSIIRILAIQASVSIIVLILGPITKEINGATYAYILGGDVWKDLGPIIVQAKISIGNFDKQSLDVMKFAQYHNPNSLGVYATSFISTSIYLILKYKSRTKSILKALLLITVGIIGWFNSLTRGPIFMVGLVFFVILLRMFFHLKTRSKLIITISFFFVAVILRERIFEISKHFFLNLEDISVLSRLDGYAYAFETISSNPIFGLPRDLQNPVPHILPLKIMTYYGVLAGVSISIPFIHISYQTLRNFIRELKNMSAMDSLYPTLFVSIILGTMLTNGVVVYVLFWIMLAESVARLKIVWCNTEQQ